jgi:hypothetical protein
MYKSKLQKYCLYYPIFLDFYSSAVYTRVLVDPRISRIEIFFAKNGPKSIISKLQNTKV